MIDTDFWNRPEVRAMKAPYKLLWSYLNCACDHAGVWTVELDVAALRLGVKLDRVEALEQFGTLVQEFGGRWLVTTFAGDQYGELNPANKVHASVIQRLEGLKKEGASEGLPSPLQGAKDKDREKDKEKEGVQGKPISEPINWPKWAGPNTIAKWEEFKAYRWEEHKVKYKSPKTEQAAVDILARYYTDGKQCVEALAFAMGKRWQFPVNPAELVGKNGHQPTQTRTDADLDAELNALRRRPGGYGPDDLRHDKELFHRAYPHLA